MLSFVVVSLTISNCFTDTIFATAIYPVLWKMPRSLCNFYRKNLSKIPATIDDQSSIVAQPNSLAIWLSYCPGNNNLEVIASRLWNLGKILNSLFIAASSYEYSIKNLSKIPASLGCDVLCCLVLCCFCFCCCLGFVLFALFVLLCSFCFLFYFLFFSFLYCLFLFCFSSFVFCYVFCFSVCC